MRKSRAVTASKDPPAAGQHRADREQDRKVGPRPSGRRLHPPERDADHGSGDQNRGPPGAYRTTHGRHLEETSKPAPPVLSNRRRRCHHTGAPLDGLLDTKTVPVARNLDRVILPIAPFWAKPPPPAPLS